MMWWLYLYGTSFGVVPPPERHPLNASDSPLNVAAADVLGFAHDAHPPHSAAKTDRDQSAGFAFALNRKFFLPKSGTWPEFGLCVEEPLD